MSKNESDMKKELMQSPKGGLAERLIFAYNTIKALEEKVEKLKLEAQGVKCAED